MCSGGTSKIRQKNVRTAASLSRIQRMGASLGVSRNDDTISWFIEESESAAGAKPGPSFDKLRAVKQRDGIR